MKKVLLGTTALAAAGLMAGFAADASAAERIKLEVSGYSQFWVVGLSQDFNDTGLRDVSAPSAPAFAGASGSLSAAGIGRSVGDLGNVRPGVGYHTSAIDFKQNAEVCFVGSTTLDNGLTVGVNVQLEASGEVTGIDESYLFVRGNFGELRMGAEDSAYDLLWIGAPNGGVSIDGEGDVVSNSFIIDTVGFFQADSTKKDFTSDDTKLTYFSPRVGGFQAALSYTPQDTGAGQRDANYKNNGAAAYRDAVSFAANYRQVFASGFGLAAFGGLEYARATNRQLGFNADGSESLNNKGQLAWSGGAQLSFAGVTVGGGYGQFNGPASGACPAQSANAVAVAGACSGTTTVVNNANTNDVSTNNRAWSIGASYETGPYKIGAEYVYTNQTGLLAIDTGESDRHVAMLSGTYTLGPGIRIVGGGFWFQQNAESNVNAGGTNIVAANGQSKSEGGGGTIALTTSF